MTARRWSFLRQVAIHWPWAWRHLVSRQTRLEWSRIATAMMSRTLHVQDWVDDNVPSLPAWVPCQACGDGPCHRDQDDDTPSTLARLDRTLGGG